MVEKQKSFSAAPELLIFAALAFVVLFAFFASLANATVYAAAGNGELTLKPGDSALVNSHKLVFTRVEQDAATGVAEARFDVYDTQGNKVQTVLLAEAGAASASNSNAARAAVQAQSEYTAPTFTVKAAQIESAGGGYGQAQIIVSTPAPTYVTTATLISRTTDSAAAKPECANRLSKMRVGDSALFPYSGVKIVLKEVSATPAGFVYSIAASFDVYDAQGNKIDTATLQAAGNAGASEYDKNGVRFKTAQIIFKDSNDANANYVDLDACQRALLNKVSRENKKEKEGEHEASDSTKSGGSSGGQAQSVSAVKPTAVAVEPGLVQPQPIAAQFVFKLARGWNMISSPFTSIASATCTATKLWHYDANARNYVDAGIFGQSTLEQGKGYWVNAKNDCSFTVDAVSAASSDANSAPYFLNGLALRKGWNQIGGPSSTVELKKVSGDCVILAAWWYNAAANRYVKTETLAPGEGYFVRVANDCVFGAGEQGIPAFPDEANS